MKRKRVERGIYRQENGTYGVYLLVAGKPRFKTIGAKLGEARRRRDLLSAKAQRGELLAPTHMTFAELAESWIEGFAAQVAAEERSERTLENYRYHLDHHLLPAFGSRRLNEITTDDCARLVASLRGRGLAAKTIAGALVPLGRVLARSPPRLHRRQPAPVSGGERAPAHYPARAARAHARANLQASARLPPRLPTLHRQRPLQRHAPLRAAGAHLGRGRPRRRPYPRALPALARAGRQARPPGTPEDPSAVRDIPLLPQLAALLKRHKLASPHSGAQDYVFATAFGTPLGYRNVERRGLRRAAEIAGVNLEGQAPLRVHDLRHTFASHLIVDLKLDVAHVSRILGHARPSITLDTYTHLFDQAAHAANIRELMAESLFGRLLADSGVGDGA
jgi:hypothetical protein